MDQVNMFGMIGMEGESTKENKKEAKKEVKKETKTTTSDLNKKYTTPKVDKNKEIEGKFKDFEKIIVKVFSNEVYSFEGEEKDNLKLESVTSNLVNGDYPELAEGIKWHLSSSVDKKTGILFAIGNFYAKG